jgi:hypothetical protein
MGRDRKRPGRDPKGVTWLRILKESLVNKVPGDSWKVGAVYAI